MTLKKLSRRMRRLILLLGGIGVLVVAGYVGLRAYLVTAHARNLVAAKLATLLGTRVEVERLQVGWRSSGVQIRVFEHSTGADSSPLLLTAQNVEAEISLPQLLRGEQPRKLILDRAHVYLRLDRDGRILTRFPQSESEGTMPAIEIRDAGITIAQEGRPEFQLGEIDGTTETSGQEVVITAAAHDPNWGEWSCKGNWNLPAGTGSLVLHSEAATIAADRVRSIPWAPSIVWDQVQPNGATSAELRLSRTQSNGEFHTKIRLLPRGATLRIPSIDWSLGSVNGSIEIDDAVVHLQNVTAQAAGGSVALNGKLDFEAEPPIMRFEASGTGIDLKQLPPSWSMPPQISGRLRGSAQLELVLHDHGIETSGTGKGEVENATVAGIPAERVELRLISDGRRFQIGRLDDHLFAYIATAVTFQPPDSAKPPLSVEVSFDFKDVDITELVQRLKLELPLQLGGKASLSAKARLPLEKAGDLQSYRVNGRLSAAQLTIEGVLLENLQAEISLENGILSVSELTARIPADRAEPGVISGSARAGLAPQTDVAASLKLENAPVALLLSRFLQPGDRTVGAATGQIDFRSPLATIRDPKSWIVDSTVHSRAFELLGRQFNELHVGIKTTDGTARLDRATVRVNRLTLTATGSLALTSPYGYSADVRAQANQPVDLQRLVPGIELPVAARGLLGGTGEVRGTLSPRTISAKGVAGASNLQIASVRVSRLDFDWSFDREQFEIRDARGQLYDGSFSARLNLPAAGGDANASVTFDSVDSAALLRDWPAMPVRMSGRVNGVLAAQYSGTPRELTANLQLTAPRLRVSGIPTENVRAKFHYRGEALDYEITGEPLDGTLLFAGRTTLTPSIVPTGRLQLKRLDLSRWNAGESTLRGFVDLDVTLRDAAGSLGGQGRLSVTGLGSGSDEIADRLVADLRIAGSIVSISGPNGRVAGGDVRTRGRYDLSGRERGFVSINLTGIDARRLLSPFPGLADQVSATVDGQIRGSLGREFNGTGQFTFSRGRVFGLTLTDLRAPFNWAFSFGNRGELKFHDITAQAGSGRIAGNAEVVFASENRVEGKVRFLGVDLKSVLTETADFGRVTGRADGRFDFRGQNVQAVEDLSGFLDLTFAQTSALEAPILRPIAPYVAPGQSFLGFTRGELKAALARGVFRIQRLTMEAPTLRIYADGNVTTEGRLDLSVNALIGQIGANSDLARLSGMTLPTIGPLPVSMLVRISNNLSNRVVRLRIGGTIRAPTVQVNAAALLSEGVVRYFLSPNGTMAFSQ